MVFSLFMILLVLVVVYFHYLQGFFSATLSAIVAVVAAAVALGWHESVIASLLGGRYADQASAMIIGILFAVIYLGLRLLIDGFIPGNVRLPAAADKIGGAVMGLITGLVAVGLLAFCAQTLPFGPSIAGYSRMPISDDRDVIVPAAAGRTQQRDAKIYGELQPDDLNAPQTGMFLPADDFVVGLVSHLSNGSLSGSRQLSEVHPDWLLELFGQRLGIEAGARRTALNTAAEQQVTVADTLVVLPQVGQRDGELEKMRELKLDRARKAKPSNVLLVVPTKFSLQASDGKDRIVRFSTGSVRLVSDGVNYFPLGTLDSSGMLVVNRPDDYLFADVSAGDATAAFVFEVPDGQVVVGKKIAEGAFLEAKRLARVDLSGKPVQERGSLAVKDGLLRKGRSGAPAAAAPEAEVPAQPPQGRDVMPVP